MYATDFEYDGLFASDWGLIICSVDSSGGIDVSSAGSEITFNTVPVQHGVKYLTTNTTYDTCLETTFQICKFSCGLGIVPLTMDDQREIFRWLNRHEPHRLKIYSDKDMYDYVLFEGCFNISKIEHLGDIIGYELHFTSNRPFALGNCKKRKFTISDPTKPYKLLDSSDEVGYVYPDKFKVKCLSDGDLSIHNSIEDRTTVIKNCSANEILFFDPILNIQTSNPDHKLSKDFNFIYFRIANTYDNRTNLITFSLPCEVEIEYHPIIKGVSL